jgi:NAD-dependent deacetylase
LPLVARAAGAQLVILNREETPLDRHADLVVRGEIGAMLAGLDFL